MVIFVCLGEIKKIIGNEVTVMVPAGKYWKWPSKEDRNVPVFQRNIFPSLI